MTAGKTASRAPASTLPALERIAIDLSRELARLRFGPPVAVVYRPLEYAWEPHRRYLARYGSGPKQVLLVGMNPGPWGMAQTGVPFGEIAAVRDWMGIEGPVGAPDRLHPKRPVTGFDCTRNEASGRRLWGWARKNFGSAEVFFRRFFVANYCPLMFIDESGANRTPGKPARFSWPATAPCAGRPNTWSPSMSWGLGGLPPNAPASRWRDCRSRWAGSPTRARPTPGRIAGGPSSRRPN